MLDTALPLEAALFRLRVVVDSARRHERLSQSECNWSRETGAAICAALRWSADNPEAAGLLIDAGSSAGTEDVSTHDRLTDFLAELLERGRGRRLDEPALPSLTEQVLAGGLVSLVMKRVGAGEASTLPGLAEEAIQLLLAPYVGTEEARLVAESLFEGESRR